MSPCHQSCLMCTWYCSKTRRFIKAVHEPMKSFWIFNGHNLIFDMRMCNTSHVWPWPFCAQICPCFHWVNQYGTCWKQCQLKLLYYTFNCVLLNFLGWQRLILSCMQCGWMTSLCYFTFLVSTCQRDNSKLASDNNHYFSFWAWGLDAHL